MDSVENSWTALQSAVCAVDLSLLSLSLVLSLSKWLFSELQHITSPPSLRVKRKIKSRRAQYCEKH